MSRFNRYVIAAGNNVGCFGEAVGRQKLFDGKVRELYNFGFVLRISRIDNGKQTGACGQDRVYGIFQTPSFAELGDWSGLEIECEQLGKFLDAKRAGSH